MRRLFKISFNNIILSITPILVWFILSFMIDKNLINVFTITYPIQFIWTLLLAIFGTGANVIKNKENNINAVYSGMIYGFLFGAIFFGLFILNIDNYLNFLGMDIHIYKEFTIFSIIFIFLQLLFAMILEKFYFENKNKVANLHCIVFNLLFILSIIITTLLFDSTKVIIITIAVLLLYITILSISQFKKFKFYFNIMKYIRYESVSVASSITYFFVYLLGLSITVNIGLEYALAYNFAALITDAQWDAFFSITTVAKIDISNNTFNYNKHLKNAYLLLAILFATSLLMFITLFSFYELNFVITTMFFLVQITNWFIYPIYSIKTCVLQIEINPKKTTISEIISNIIRFFCSLLSTPFCIGIGQLSASFFQLFSRNYLFHKEYKIFPNGAIKKK